MNKLVNFIKNEKNISILFILVCSFFVVFLAYIQPIDCGPDEKMKMDICNYIANNGKLPHGGDESIRDPIWGISYGFTPILDYVFAGIIIKIFSNFTQDVHAFYFAARLVSCIFYSIFIVFIIKIGDKLFNKKFYKCLFVGFVCLLPQMLFLASYVNNDAFAMMCISIIVYAWIRGLQNNWNIKDCIILAVGIGLCALSYYNSYGYILTSIILFISSNLLNKTKYSDILKKGLIISGIVLLLCGWWFIRSAIIYDGDFLGLETTNEYSNKYAIKGFKASDRQTPQKKGMSLINMLFAESWLELSFMSFIAVFGNMNIPVPRSIYIFAFLILLVGVLGYFIKVFNKKYIKELKNNKTKLQLDIIFIINIIITVSLSIYYSYTSDFQAQGRYIMPILIPSMYFVTTGFENLLERIKNKNKIYILTEITLCICICGTVALCMKHLINQYI